MRKKPNKKEIFFRVRSKVNNDEYYSSNLLPTKEIDGKVFMGVKKAIGDSNIFFMKKENMEILNRL